MCIIGLLVAAVLLFVIFFKKRESYTAADDVKLKTEEVMSALQKNTTLTDDEVKTLTADIINYAYSADPVPGDLEKISNFVEVNKSKFPVIKAESDALNALNAVIAPLIDKGMERSRRGQGPEDRREAPARADGVERRLMPMPDKPVTTPMKGKVVAFTPGMPRKADSVYRPYMCKDGPDGLVCKVNKQ
jgi:hypothetical protein